MRDRTHRLITTLLLVFSIAVLAAAGSLYLDNDGGYGAGASLHLTQAGWQETVAPGYTTPPPTQDSGALPPAWTVVALPFSPSTMTMPPPTDTALKTSTLSVPSV